MIRSAACTNHPFQTFKRPVVAFLCLHSPPAALTASPAVFIGSGCDRMRDVLCVFAEAYFDISWRLTSQGRESKPPRDGPLT